MTNVGDGEPKVQLVVYTGLKSLAEELAFQRDREQILDFILHLDTMVAEEEFTVALIERLKDSLDEEEPADSVTIASIRGRLNHVMAALHELDNAING